MNIFAKDVAPVKVKLDKETEYTARAVTIRAAETVYAFKREDVYELMKERYHYNEERNAYETDSLPRDLQLEFAVILNTQNSAMRLITVMASSAVELDAKTALDWFLSEPEFFDKCYEAALSLNPKFAPAEEAPNQAETKEEAALKN